jgi:hypothetical protein
MIKQCGNCEFWARDNAIAVFPSGRSCAPCGVPLPIWLVPSSEQANYTWEDIGQDCPLYKEKQDIEEDDGDLPDENGYTRADEDWFFDDKDD